MRKRERDRGKARRSNQQGISSEFKHLNCILEMCLFFAFACYFVNIGRLLINPPQVKAFLTRFMQVAKMHGKVARFFKAFFDRMMA